VSRQRTALSVAYRSSRGQISGSVCIGYIGIRAGTPNRSDSARSVGLGIKYNSGLPMRHSESALVSASASTSPWPKPYSDWPRCCADSASRQLPLLLPRSTRGYLFGQKKYRTPSATAEPLSVQVRFRRLECHDESEPVRYSTRRLLQRKGWPILTMPSAGKDLPGDRSQRGMVRRSDSQDMRSWQSCSA
jgi:hypothetical protein